MIVSMMKNFIILLLLAGTRTALVYVFTFPVQHYSLISQFARFKLLHIHIIHATFTFIHLFAYVFEFNSFPF